MKSVKIYDLSTTGALEKGQGWSKNAERVKRNERGSYLVLYHAACVHIQGQLRQIRLGSLGNSYTRSDASSSNCDLFPEQPTRNPCK